MIKKEKMKPIDENVFIKSELKYYEDNRSQCCIDHEKYFSTCDTCEYSDWRDSE